MAKWVCQSRSSKGELHCCYKWSNILFSLAFWQVLVLKYAPHDYARSQLLETNERTFTPNKHKMQIQTMMKPRILEKSQSVSIYPKQSLHFIHILAQLLTLILCTKYRYYDTLKILYTG